MKQAANSSHSRWSFELKQGSIWLHIRGPEGVKTIIEGMMTR